MTSTSTPSQADRQQAKTLDDAVSPPDLSPAQPPLHKQPSPDVAWQADGHHETVVEDISWRPEIKMIIRLAAPAIVQGAAQQAMLITDQLFVGHLGTKALAAAALGTSYNNVMWGFLQGSATALDTLGAQAFGARNRTALLRVTLTSMAVQSVFCLIVTVALCFGEPVAEHLFGQDEEVSALVGQYCYLLIPGMWPLVLGLCLMKYLQAQNLMMLPALISVAAFLMNIGCNAALVSLLDFKGSPLATSISRFFQFVLLVIAIYRHEKQHQREHTSLADTELVSAPLLADGCAGASDEPLRTMAKAGTELPEVQDTAKSERSEDAALKLLPWRGAADHEQHSSSETMHERPGSGSGKGRLMKTLSWFRSPSWHALNGRESEPGEAVRSTSDSPSPVRYWTSQLRASVHPQLLARYLKLALPGGLMLAFEGAAFDVTTAMAGHLGSVITAAHAALLGIVYFTYSALPFAISTAITIRVGNLLGAGQPLLARRSGYLSICLSAGCMTLVAITILACRNVLGRAFSSDPEVISTMAMIAPYAALFQVSDGVMGPSQGILRGCGRQLQIMCTNVLGFWALGVFLGYMLTFHAGLGVHGLWIGIASGDFAGASLNMISLHFLNWRKEAQAAAVVIQDLQQPDDLRSSNDDSALLARNEMSHRRRKADLHPVIINQC